MSMNMKMISVLLFIVSLFTSFSVNATKNQTNTINFMTFNIASLPTILGFQIANDGFLRPNSERVTEIVNVINLWNQKGNKTSDGIVPNVIAFEEAFDPDVRYLLQTQLAASYPYNSGEYGQEFMSAGSGLLLFSQYPILEITFHPYTNMMIGEETLANKGFITAKLQLNDKYFFTVIITHLEAGGAIWRDEQVKEDGTTSARRGVQMGEIYNEIKTFAYVPPSGYEKLKYLKSFVMGDFNVTLDSERQQKSISTGLSDNGFKEGDIKYPGQNMLFTILINTIPSNFFNVRVLPKEKGQSKKVDPALLAQATQQNLFTGSIFTDSLLTLNRNDSSVVLNRQATGYKVIDGIFTTHDGVDGNLQTMITSLNESSSYPYSMSDHLAVLGKFDIFP
jgi:endonuclease/exonuclease/phosphatase family metal-dependent hydrolase